MTSIIIGTTPTIKYTFQTVDVATITRAILTIKNDDAVILTKELSDATVGDDYIEWHLSQADTLAIGTDGGTVMLNWLLSDGTRGATKEKEIKTIDNHIPEVI